MAIAENDSDQGHNLNLLEVRVLVNRRDFLGLSAASALTFLGIGCEAQKRPVLVQTKGDKNEAEKADAGHKSLREMEGMFYDDIMNYGKATTMVDGQTSALARNAAYVRGAYASGKFKKGGESERLGLLAHRYTDLVACSLVRDLPLVPDKKDLEALVRLDIAETIISNEAARNFVHKKREVYRKWYKKGSDEIDEVKYEGIKLKILSQSCLSQEYKDNKDIGRGLIRFSGQLVDGAEPFDDIAYGLEHMDLPATPAEEKAIAESRGGSASEHVKRMVKVCDNFRREHESSLIHFLEAYPIGRLEEAPDESGQGKKMYHFRLNPSVVQIGVTNYNNSLASADLRYGRKMNTLIELALRDEWTYSKDQRYQLAVAGSRLRTGLAWKEKVVAEEAYSNFGKDEKKTIELARAASHALAAYVLASDSYDQAVFKGMLDDYKKQMNRVKVSRETRREADVEVLFPYYLDELNDRKRRAFLTGMWGVARTALIGYSLTIGGDGGAGGSGAAGGFTIGGGLI